MIIEFSRITKEGDTVPCSLPAESISTIEVSNRDGMTTIIRTERGMIAVSESYEEAVDIWRKALAEGK